MIDLPAGLRFGAGALGGVILGLVPIGPDGVSPPAADFGRPSGNSGAGGPAG